MRIVAATRDWHPPDHESFSEQGGPWPVHCVQGTPGAAFHKSLQIPHAGLVLRKGMDRTIDSYSVLYENDRKTPTGLAGYLKELAGKRIELSGFMQPLGDDGDTSSFMLIEYPVGCWYCEMPETTGIVLVELAQRQAARFTRGLVKVVGKLTLNATDPENFLYTVGEAKVAEAD